MLPTACWIDSKAKTSSKAFPFPGVCPEHLLPGGAWLCLWLASSAARPPLRWRRPTQMLGLIGNRTCRSGTLSAHRTDVGRRPADRGAALGGCRAAGGEGRAGLARQARSVAWQQGRGAQAGARRARTPLLAAAAACRRRSTQLRTSSSSAGAMVNTQGAGGRRGGQPDQGEQTTARLWVCLPWPCATLLLTVCHCRFSPRPPARKPHASCSGGAPAWTANRRGRQTARAGRSMCSSEQWWEDCG